MLVRFALLEISNPPTIVFRPLSASRLMSLGLEMISKLPSILLTMDSPEISDNNGLFLRRRPLSTQEAQDTQAQLPDPPTLVKPDRPFKLTRLSLSSITRCPTFVRL